MRSEKKRTIWAVLLLLLVVALVSMLAWGPMKRERIQKILIDAPAGTYIAYLPSASSGGRTIILQLNNDTQKTAVFTEDYQNGKAPITKSGTWQREGEKTLVVTLPKEQLKFTVEDTKIILDNPVESGYGNDGIELGISPIPFPSQWKWVDTRLPGNVIHVPELGTSFVMTLTSDMKVSVAGDCNALMGTFTLYGVDDASFAVNGSTRMMCQKSLETTFMSDINRTTAYTVDKDMLILSLEGDIQGYGTMTFVRITESKDVVVGDIPSGTIPDGGQPPLPAPQPTPTPQPAPEPQPTPQPQPLPDPTYTLVSYNGKAVDSDQYTFTLGESTIGARFCNIMGGSYELKNSIITAPQLISTQMFCEQPEGLMDMESAFGALLSRGAELTIDGKSLTLRGDRTTLVYELKEVIKQR